MASHYFGLIMEELLKKIGNRPGGPTLEDRLKHAITSELEALEQLATTIPLSEYGKKRLQKLRARARPVDI